MENAPLEILSSENYKRLFHALPDAYLILAPNKEFTIIEVSDAYLRATNTHREQIMGKPLFEVFPDDPNAVNPSGVNNLTDSLTIVMEEKRLHEMAVQHYNIPRPEGGPFEERWWAPRNLPVLDDERKIICIIHNVTDVTKQAKLVIKLGDSSSADSGVQNELALKIHELETLNTLLISRENQMTKLRLENEELRNKLQNSE